MGQRVSNDRARVRLLFVLLAITVPAAAADKAAVPRSPHAVVHGIGLDDVAWTEGFWKQRLETVRDRSIPAMWEIMKGTKYKPFYQNFVIAAGEAEGDYHGAPWNDGDFYKFLEAVTVLNAQGQDPALDSILEPSIRMIGKAQRADGYIHTPVLIRARNGDRQARPFEDRKNFEMYNMGHLITAACVHHRLTGRPEFLAIARKTADFLCESFRSPTPELARNSVCPSHYMAMVDLYRTTGEPRYLELAKKFLDMRNLVTGDDDNQDRIPFIEQQEAMGHAVRANYLYAGAADVFLETGDQPSWNALAAIWRNAAEKKTYLTGGCGALYDGASPDGSPDQSSIARVHQAYGRNYQLPNVTAHNETCAAIGSVLWNWRMFEATGEARFVDALETALYNATLAGISLDGTKYFYVNPLRQVEPLPTKLRWPRERVPFMTSYCCPPNVLRTIAEVGGYAYGRSIDAIWVNLYGGNQLKTTIRGLPLRITQMSDYPWDGRVQIRVDECPATEFAIKLRVPGWAEHATLKVNGARFDAPTVSGTYTEIRRAWKAGDLVELELPMPAQLIEANPLVEEAVNQAAVKRGPIVYCLESPDLPEGVRVQDAAIRRDAKLSAKYEPMLLGGVGAVETKLAVRPAGEWEGKLYRPLGHSQAREITGRLIPYYAWSNRGKSEMSVWLPIQ